MARNMSRKLFTILGGIAAVSVAAGFTAFIKERVDEKKDRFLKHHQGFYERFIKRPLDAFLASGTIIVLSPLLLLTAIGVRIKLGSPVLFIQERPGRDEKIFKMYKFRTMLPPKDGVIDPTQDAARLTPFGRKLRSTSLDELPELINIIKGDMAVVGPRPLLVRYLSRYNEFQHRRHEVRPGLTGLAQVEGRNALSWDEKFKYDVEYIDHITFWGDLRIILKTAGKVFMQEGINEAENTTMEEFRGNEVNVDNSEINEADLRKKICKR